MPPINHNPLLMIALIFGAGYPAGLLAKKLGVPKVTGNILAGILLGPSFISVFDETVAAELEPLTIFAMGLITCVVGGHLSYRRLHNALRRILSVAFFETLFTVLFVSAGAYWLTHDAVISLLIGPIAAATAPATVLAVVREERAKGLLIKTLFAAVALDNVLAVVLFSLARAQVRAFIGGDEAIGAGIFLAFRELFFSVMLGGTLGWVLTRLVRRKDIEPFSGLLLAILLTTGGAEALGVSPLLSSLVLGVFLGNSGRESEKWVTSLESLEPMLMTCFFTLAGVDCEIGSLGHVGALGGVYILARSAGKLGGGFLGGMLGTKIARVYNTIGAALLPHAGLAIGLVVILQSDSAIAAAYPEMVKDLTNVVLASVVVFEIVGPPLVRRSISKADEAGKDRQRIVEFLQEEYILTPLDAKDKWDAIRKLAAFLIRTHGIQDLTVEDLIESVEEREKSISTAMGSGVAIPHAKIPSSGPEIMGVMGISPNGIDFDAPDKEPVHYIILIATPKEHQRRHLQVMAAVAKMISNPEIRAKLLIARTPAEVYEVIEIEPSENYNYFLED